MLNPIVCLSSSVALSVQTSRKPANWHPGNSASVVVDSRLATPVSLVHRSVAVSNNSVALQALLPVTIAVAIRQSQYIEPVEVATQKAYPVPEHHKANSIHELIFR